MSEWDSCLSEAANWLGPSNASVLAIRPDYRLKYGERVKTLLAAAIRHQIIGEMLSSKRAGQVLLKGIATRNSLLMENPT